MIVITAGRTYLDIDSYACCVAYAELLTRLGKDAKAISTAVLNESIPASLRALPISIETEYQPHADDSYVLVDMSDPDYFANFVDVARVAEIFDHHPGFEDYWHAKIGGNSHIDFIGAAATLIYEQWEKAGKLAEMSQASAMLLAAAILDNTLNFGASVTTSRDKKAYQFLKSHATIDDAWIANYFSECQQAITADLPKALRNDTKFLVFPGLPKQLCVGQIVVWDAKTCIANESDTIASLLTELQPEWFANLVSISEGRSYFLAQNRTVKEWLQQTLGVTFKGQTAKADRLWLRKEIMKAAQVSKS